MIWMERGTPDDSVIPVRDDKGKVYQIQVRREVGGQLDPTYEGPVQARMADSWDTRRVEWCSRGHYRISDPDAPNGEILVSTDDPRVP